MGKTYLSIPDDLVTWMKAQQMFFVASAPLAGVHINVSPKGYPSRTFAILDSNTVAYIDGTGSGCETVSHIYENGRATIMFCSFEISPKIVRLFCRGRVIEKDDEEFGTMIARMGEGYGSAGARAVIVLKVFKTMTSCGFAVPLLHEAAKGARAMDGNCTTNANDRALEEAIPPGFRTREMLERQYLEFLRKDKRFLESYRKDMNRRSLDGLPGLRTARRDKGEWLMWEDLKVGIWRLLRQWDAIMLGVVFTLSSMMALRAFNVKV